MIHGKSVLTHKMDGVIHGYSKSYGKDDGRRDLQIYIQYSHNACNSKERDQIYQKNNGYHCKASEDDPHKNAYKGDFQTS